MGILSELLSNIATHLAIHKLALARKKNLYYILGFICIAVSGLLLFLYVFVYTSTLVENYTIITIEYSNCYAINPIEYRRIVLDAGTNKYEIYHPLWRKDYDEEMVISNLRKSMQATIWLASNDSNDIKGISTQFFKIDPSIGAAWDNSNRKALLWSSIMFFALGVLVITAVYLDKEIERAISP
ncbi:MAG: hypothetical protein MN733_39375 [Nitrososphaera sp.]|nr:hypothetical protein [Nitrososphaera sp.]